MTTSQIVSPSLTTMSPTFLEMGGNWLQIDLGRKIEYREVKQANIVRKESSNLHW